MLIVAYGIFFFILRDKLPFTPDFGSSDAFHSNVSFKYYLWHSIRSGILPFWTDKLAGGFPLIAETQIGAFFLPHYFVFPLFSNFSHAYMFLFSFHLLLLSVGMFLLLTILQIPTILSFLLALTFTWSGAISFRWVHFNFLQVISLCPLLFWTYFNWNNTQKKRYALFISFLIAQMIFAGHMQTTFIFLLGLLATHVLLNYPLKVAKTFHFFCWILFGFILAAPQVVPTIQLSTYSARSFVNSYQYVVSFLFNSRDLIGFFSSKGLGTPLNATYGSLISVGNRIYWENTPYIGELFFITLLLATIYYFIISKKQLQVWLLLLLSLLFLFLAYGGDSPFYFLFGLFPFNMFRTPPRYLLVSVFFLILFSGYILKTVIKKHTLLLIFVYCVLVVNCIVLVKTAFTYHLFIDSQRLLGTLATYSKTIPNGSYYFTFGGNEAWYNTFVTKGWKTKQDIDTYLFLNSALLPNSNLINGLSTFDIYTGGLKMRRNEYIKSIIFGSLSELTKKQATPTIGTKLEKMLQLYNIGTIISVQHLNIQNFVKVQSKNIQDIGITLWQSKHSKNNLFYVPTQIKSLSYLEDIEKEIALETVSEKNAFAESLSNTINQKDTVPNIQIVKNNEQYLKSIITAPENMYMVIKKGWYPEWHLYIDGKETTIYKTNLIHMGFFISKGKHALELVYIPTSFYIGCAIALVGLLIVIGFIIKRTPGEF